MSFKNKEVKRAIRDFERKAENLINAGSRIYQTRVNEFVNLIKSNKVINSIVGPYFEIEIDFEEIENQSGGTGWFNLTLPEDEDRQIAYVLQIMKLSSEGNFNIDKYALHAFAHKSLDHNLSDWNQQVLIPCLQLISDKLQDLIEDEVEGKEEISESVLSIINFGEINAEQGNVAIGQSITQSIETGNISKEIVERALEKEVISTQEEIEGLKEVTSKIEEELSKDTPSKSSLKSFVGKLYEIGQNGLLTIAGNVITNPIWSDAVASYLLNII